MLVISHTLKNRITYYQETTLGKLIYPIKTFQIPEKDLIVVYQNFALNLSPQKFYHEFLIFNKISGELMYKFTNHRFSINDVLLVKPNKLLLACGDYDGGMNYNGELLVLDLLEDKIETLFTGRYFNKCEFNKKEEIEVTVFPYEDDSFSPPELYKDTTYKLDLSTYLTAIEDLEIIKQEKHTETFQRFDKWIENSIAEISEHINPNIKFSRAGSIRHMELVNSKELQYLISTIDNIGIRVINSKDEKIDCDLREGWFRQLQIVNGKIYATFCERGIYDDVKNILLRYCQTDEKIEEIHSGEFSSFAIDKDENILILNNRHKPKRDHDYTYLASKRKSKGNFSQKNINYYAVITNDKKHLYFMASDYQHPDSVFKLSRFSNFNTEEIWQTNKFIASYNSESYFVINNRYLIFHGRLSPDESTESLMYGLMIADLNSQEEITIVKNKEHYFQINVDYDEMRTYCLTTQSDLEVYKVETGELIEIIDLKEFTEEIVISVNANSGILAIGTIYGSIIKIDVREITIGDDSISTPSS